MGMFALLAVGPVAIHSTTYYANPSTGSDSNNGLSPGSAFATLQHAANIMGAGDTCVAAAGDYDEKVDITNSGASGSPLVFQAQPGAKTKGFDIEGADYVHIIGFEMTVNGVSVKQGSFCQILDNNIHDTGYVGVDLVSSPAYADNESTSDCIVRGNRINYPVKCGIHVAGRRHLIEDNEISHTLRCSPYSEYCTDADGIRFFGSGHVFRRNEIRDILHSENPGDPHIDCFQTWRTARNILFDGNVCVNPNTYGSNQIVMMEEWEGDVIDGIVFQNNIFVFSDPGYCPMNINQKRSGDTIDNVSIVHNLFFHTNTQGMGEYAINLQRVDGAIVKNNIFVDYGDADRYVNYLRTPDSTNVDISHNLVFTTSGVPPYGGPYPNDLWMVDPKLTDPANEDFEPAADSPVVDAGTSIPSVTEDILGRPRPQGNGPDIGPYELGGAPPIDWIFQEDFESGDTTAWSSVFPEPPPGPSKLIPVGVTASTHDGNVPENTLDGDLGTRWSAEGDPQWISFDLGSVMSVQEVRIAYFLGDQRYALFDLQVSQNGADWSPVYSGQSSGSSLQLERLAFSPTPARYVRYLGHGNSQNLWNSLTEVEIWGTP
jgi:hypothetical protein